MVSVDISSLLIDELKCNTGVDPHDKQCKLDNSYDKTLHYICHYKDPYGVIVFSSLLRVIPAPPSPLDSTVKSYVKRKLPVEEETEEHIPKLREQFRCQGSPP